MNQLCGTRRNTDMNDLRGAPFGFLVIRLHLKTQELSL